MDLDRVQWRWFGGLVVALLAISAAFSLVYDVPFLTVLLPFSAMVLVGLTIGWMLRYITRFNPYDY